LFKDLYGMTVSSVGFWENLGQKGVDGILKVVIVSFLYYISWVSGLCNNINIVSRVQLEKNLLTPTSIYTVSGIVNADLLRVKRLGPGGCLEKNTEYTQNSI